MQYLFEKIYQCCLSLESNQDTQIAKYVLLKCIKETRFTIILFYFLSAMTCLSLTLQKKTLKPSQKMVSILTMNELNELHTLEF